MLMSPQQEEYGGLHLAADGQGFMAFQRDWTFLSGSCSTAIAGWLLACKRREEEGLHGVFKRLRRNGHQLIKGSCKQFNTDCHS
jgi:hypothetical protein